ncbi:MAG: GntR family transcriptional regulator [Croceivirga sp.]
MPAATVLRDRVKAHLLESIHHGEIQFGHSLNLAALSRKLGVSVTPIREALSQLEQCGIVKAIPNRGFIVPEFSIQEAKNLFSTLAELQVLALESSTFDEMQLAQLSDEQRLLQQTHTPSARLASRVTFHRLLRQQCENRILLDLITNLEARVVFYEQVFIMDAAFYEQIDNQNDAILRSIQENNIPTAALILKMNWMTVAEFVQQQLILQQVTTYEEL